MAQPESSAEPNGLEEICAWRRRFSL